MSVNLSRSTENLDLNSDANPPLEDEDYLISGVSVERSMAKTLTDGYPEEESYSLTDDQIEQVMDINHVPGTTGEDTYPVNRDERRDAHFVQDEPPGISVNSNSAHTTVVCSSIGTSSRAPDLTLALLDDGTQGPSPRVSILNGAMHTSSLYMATAPSPAPQHDSPLPVCTGPSADMNAQKEIQLTKAHVSQDEKQEGCIQVVISESLPEKIQVVGENGVAMDHVCEPLETDAFCKKPSYAEQKQISEAEAMVAVSKSFPNGKLCYQGETSVEDKEQEAIVQTAEIILDQVSGNEKIESYSVLNGALGTGFTHATESFQDVYLDSKHPRTEDCPLPSHKEPNIGLHLPEIGITEQKICAIDVGGGRELAGGFSKLEQNQNVTFHSDEEEVTQVSGHKNQGTVVIDLDNSHCTSGSWKVGDEFIKKDVSQLEDSDKVAEIKEMGCALRSYFLDGLHEMSADSLREVDQERTQLVVNAEPVTKLDQVKSVGKKDLHLEKEREFSANDLVWGKVKSHPWWPGQIFDLSDASERAKKYKKKDSFLVAYFGDQTFAWNEASSLNHFQTHFSQMEKQSNSEAFRTAVDYALDEVRRRVELGMTCSCTPKEVYANVKSQIIENAGIRKEAKRMHDLDNSLSAASFNSGELLQSIKALAPNPCDGVDRLELKIAQARLLAFYRLKGYCRLPEFHVYGGLLDDVFDISSPEERSYSKEKIEHETPVSRNVKNVISEKARLERRDRSRKRKDVADGGLHPSREKRSLSDLMAGKKAPSHISNNGKNSVDERATSKSASSAGIRRNSDDFCSDKSAVISIKRMSSFPRDVDTESSTPQSFKVGECIRRIASQLSGSPPILKCSGERFQKIAAKLDRVMDNGEINGSPYIPKESHRLRVSFLKNYRSHDEMLSQLCLAARDPMKGYSFLNTIVDFFSDFRNSISLEFSTSGKQKRSGKVGDESPGNGIRKPFNTETGSSRTFDFEEMSDSYWTDRIIQSSPEEQPSRRSRKGEGLSQSGVPTKLDTSSFEAEDPFQSSPVPDLEEKVFDDDYVLVKVKQSRKYRKRKRKSEHVLPMDENKFVNDFSPTALLMNFTESGSIPSKSDLNKIFRRFGPLKESETEVIRDTSSARVVFKKQTDAEVALSSAAKFSIFGSLRVNYQLRFKA